MKRIIVLVALCTIIGKIYSQDLIITEKSDTIQCKINRISELYIHYTEVQRGLEVRSRILKDRVLSYEWNSKDQPPPVLQPKEPVEPTPPSQEPEKFEIPDFSESWPIPNFRLALNAGYTYQFEGYQGLPQSYIREVSSLLNLGISAHLFPSEGFGIGVKYNRASTDVQYQFEPAFSNLIGFTNIEESIRFTYLALSILSRQILRDERQVVYYQLSGGIVSYRDNGTLDGIPFFEEGETFGLALGIGYDYSISPNYGIGLGVEVNIATINTVNVNGTQISGAGFAVSRVDLTAGFRIFR